MTDQLKLYHLHKAAHSILACLLTLWVFLPQELEAADSPAFETQDNESAIRLSNSLIAQQSLLKQRIAAIETELGPYTEALLNPLVELSKTYIDLGDYRESNRILSERLQLHRVLDGPTSLKQLPTITELISNGIQQKNWTQVTEQFQLVDWLYTNNSKISVEEKLKALNDVAAWYLAAVYLDRLENQLIHRIEYIELTERMLDLAEQELGKDSELVIPWLYQSSLAIYQYGAGVKTAARNRPSMISKRIRRIVERGDKLEAVAMAMVFEADVMKLSSPIAPANRLYLQARKTFREAGIDEARIDAFFNQATIIPMAKFHFSIDSAMAEQEPFNSESILNIETDDEINEVMEFIAWQELLPAFSRPRRPGRPASISGARTPIYSTLLELEVNTRGYVNSVRTLGSVPDDHTVRNHAERGVSRLVFRPNPVNWWKAQKRTVNLLYSYPPKNINQGY